MEQAGQTAARLAGLLLGGSGTLGVITSHAMRAVIDRQESFQRRLSEKRPDIQIVETMDIHETPEGAYQSAEALLEHHPGLNALYITCGCVPDICRAVRDRGSNLQIICYERYPAIVRLVKAGEIACTISGGLQSQGRLAMRLLFEYLIYDRTPDGPTVYTKNEILFRENI
jgi:ABC-type sugar transport system substrate-binding protein